MFSLSPRSVHLWLLSYARGEDSKALASRILGCYLSQKDLIFEEGPQGKPYLKNQALQFNYSHSGAHFLMGVTKDRAIGVDIEHARANKNFLAIAKRFFAASEYERLLTLPKTAQEAAFYHCWTLKEAYIKAVGAGLSLGLGNFDVDFLKQTDCLIKSHDDKRWQLDKMALDFPEYYAALCVEDGYTSAQCFDESNFLCSQKRGRKAARNNK